MKKLFLIVLLLPLLFAVETEEKKFRIPMGIQEHNYGYVEKGDTNWVSFNFIEIDTLITPVYKQGWNYELDYMFRTKIREDTLLIPRIIVEYKGQKFKIMLEPIIEEKR